MQPRINRQAIRESFRTFNFNKRHGDYYDLSIEIQKPKEDLDKQIDDLLSTLTTDNKESLVNEMADILQQFAEKFQELEIMAESRRRKQLQQLTGDYNSFCEEEEKYQRKLQTCKDTLCLFEKNTNLSSDFRMTRLHGKDLYNRINNFSAYTKGKHRLEKQKELDFCLRQIMIRFAELCELENVDHNIPISIIGKITGNITPPLLSHPEDISISGKRPNKSEHIFRKHVSAKQVSNRERFKKNEHKPQRVIENMPNIKETYDGKLDKNNITTPTAFVEVYCKMNGLEPKYDILGVIKTSWNNEQILIGKVLKYAGEGRGKRKATAKQCAAANLIKTIIARQRKGNLAQELKPLSIDQLELAIMLMSEYLPFDEDLEMVSHGEYQKSPIYTPLLNTTGNYIRCKALGLNAVGNGKTKDIARRMSAKLVLDKYQEIKEQKKKNQKLYNNRE